MKNNGDIWSLITAKDRCFIIAEAGSNHNGDLSLAKKMIDAACDAHADAVKFQFFEAGKIAANTNDRSVQINGLTPQNFYRDFETPREWIPELVAYCKKKGILFSATPFDHEAVDLLSNNDMEFFKVASFEIVDLPLLKKIAQTQKPIILSTGMADLDDIRDAVSTIFAENNHRLILLHCGINYPLPFCDVNLRAMLTLQNEFHLPVGYSDHTSGITVPVAAVAMGAQVIEKHFTLSRKMEGPDHGFALEPTELKQMVTAIRECGQALGTTEKKCLDQEKIHYLRGRRSIFASRDIKKGRIVSKDDLAILRPGTGLKPKYLDEIIGKPARKDMKKDEPVQWDLIR